MHVWQRCIDTYAWCLTHSRMHETLADIRCQGEWQIAAFWGRGGGILTARVGVDALGDKRTGC